MKFAHPADDRLAGFFIGPDEERRVFLGEAVQGTTELLLVDLGLGLDGDGYDRSRESHRFELNRVGSNAESVAGGRVLQPDCRDDVPGEDVIYVLAGIGVHPQDPAEAFLLAVGRVQDGVALRGVTGVDTEVGEFPYVRVAHDLESQCGKRSRVFGWTGQQDVLIAGLEAGDGGQICRARQVCHDCIEKGLDALVLECRAAEHRSEVQFGDTGANGCVDLRGRDLGFFEVLLHDLLVGIG